MKQIRTSLNYNYLDNQRKIFTQPSQTIPDQTMSIREILERHSRGLDLGGQKESIFEEDGEPTSGINPRILDLVDFQEMKEKNQEKIDMLTSDLDKKKAAKAAKDQQAKENALRDKIIAEINKNPEGH